MAREVAEGQGEAVKFGRVYEGLATVSYTSKNFIGLHLETGEKIRNMPVNHEIAKNSRPLDEIFIIMGQKDDRWWPIDIVSIGSIIFGKKDEFHVSFNPELLERLPESCADGQ